MIAALIELVLFAAKAIFVVLLIVIVLVAIVAALSKGKDKAKGHCHIKNLNKKMAETKEAILAETLTHKSFKKFLKAEKAEKKALEKHEETPKNIYVLNFHGDLRATPVCALAEEINAILSVATPNDEVILRLESTGGVVHGYGLAAAQLMRLRDHHIPLTVTIDKVAASGGYMMACVANKILAAPFAIVGSIGVIVQLPNFHRLLKDKDIDVEQQTAGAFKRTITMFGENTDEGRKKLQHEIEDIHEQFKDLILAHRPNINIQKVSTGEHWLGQEAHQLHLVDEIQTSDEYLLTRSKDAQLFEICYETKKSLLGRLTSSAKTLVQGIAQRF